MTCPKPLSWRNEHGAEYDVPQEVLDLVSDGRLHDVSWHNDACPSFWTMNDRYVLWVDHPDPEQREMRGSRFLVTRNSYESDKNVWYNDPYVEFYNGDDVETAVQRILQLGEDGETYPPDYIREDL